jgi:hypothetical protein
MSFTWTTATDQAKSVNLSPMLEAGKLWESSFSNLSKIAEKYQTKVKTKNTTQAQADLANATDPNEFGSMLASMAERYNDETLDFDAVQKYATSLSSSRAETERADLLNSISRAELDAINRATEDAKHDAPLLAQLLPPSMGGLQGMESIRAALNAVARTERTEKPQPTLDIQSRFIAARATNPELTPEAFARLELQSNPYADPVAVAKWSGAHRDPDDQSAASLAASHLKRAYEQANKLNVHTLSSDVAHLFPDTDWLSPDAMSKVNAELSKHWERAGTLTDPRDKINYYNMLRDTLFSEATSRDNANWLSSWWNSGDFTSDSNQALEKAVAEFFEARRQQGQ